MNAYDPLETPLVAHRRPHPRSTRGRRFEPGPPPNWRTASLVFAEVARLIGRGATNARILIGILMEAVFFAILLVMLKSWDVSLIWPLTSLGFVLTTLAAKFLRDEHVSSLRWSGVFLIMAGAALVAYSEAAKKAVTAPGSAQVVSKG